MYVQRNNAPDAYCENPKDAPFPLFSLQPNEYCR